MPGLHVRVARHDDVVVTLGLANDDALEFADRLLHVANGVAQVHLRRGRRLVVAAAPRVQTSARRTDDLGHALFDGHVDVFVLDGEDESTGADFFTDLLETADDRVGVFARDDALAREHVGVHLRVANVERADALLERDRGVEVFNELVGGEVEASAAALGFLLGHVGFPVK